MLFFFILFGLILLISGGIGLFYTNVNLLSGTPLWVFGNITFAPFVVLGMAILVFIAIFNAEFE